MAQTKVKLISDGVIVQGNLLSNHGITTAHIGEGSNLYYTDARVSSYLSTNSFATESYVGTQITNLVDSSPATLNTLNELAAALGDDPNFATTTATSIGLKAPLASPSFTGNSTFAGDVGLGGTGIYTSSHSLNIDGTGLAIKNDTAGSSNNWSNIRNTAILSSSNLVFTTGLGDALTLNHDKSATFSGNVHANERVIVSGNTNTYATAPLVYFDSTSTADAGVRDWAIGPADDSYGNFHFFAGASTGANPVGNSGRVLTITNTGNATFSGQINAGTKISLPDGGDLFWGGGYGNGGPVLAANGTSMKMYPSGAVSGVQFSLSPTVATFGGDVKTTGAAIGTTQADGDYVSKLYTLNADGFLSLYTGQATPLEKVRITSYGNNWIDPAANGNFGIGTASPNAKLEVNVPTGGGILIKSADVATFKMKGAGGVYDWGLATTNLAASDFGMYKSNAGGGDPITAGTAQLYFKSTSSTTSDVGIGTTGPNEKLHVVGNIFLNANSAFKASYNNTDNYHGSMRWAGLQLGNNGTNKIIAGRTAAGGGFQFYTNNTVDAADYTVASDGIMTMAMTNTGNVGIGETAPGTLLSLRSPLANTSIVTLKCTKNDSSWTAGDRIGGINFFGEDGSGQGAGIKGSINYIVTSSSGGSNAMTFNVAGTANNQEKMRIQGGGNIGIGTDSPTTTLSVKGTSSNGINIIGVGTTATRVFAGLNASNHGYLFVTGSSGQSPSLINSAGGDSYISGKLQVGTSGWGGVGALVVNSTAGDNGGIVDTHANGGARYYSRVAHGHTGSSSAGYWHIKTNIIPNANIMFLAKFYGYLYGQSAILDLQHSGYAYSGGSVIAQGTINNSSVGGISSAIYLTSSNQVCFRIDMGGSTYYAGLWMDIGFQNPTGGNHQLEILGSTFSATTNYYT